MKLNFVLCNVLLLRFPYVQVYDVTPFMEDHPGGDEVLLSATGNLFLQYFSYLVLQLILLN